MKSKLSVIILIVTIFLTRSTFSQRVDAQWKYYPFKGFHFSIQSPFPFDSKSASNKNGQFVISAFDAKQDFMIGLTVTELKGNYANVPLGDIPRRVLKALETTTGPNAKTISKLITLSSQPAILTNTTYLNKKNKLRKIKALNIKKDNTWWGILIMYDGGNEESEKMAERAIHSFRILD